MQSWNHLFELANRSVVKAIAQKRSLLQETSKAERRDAARFMEKLMDEVRELLMGIPSPEDAERFLAHPEVAYRVFWAKVLGLRVPEWNPSIPRVRIVLDIDPSGMDFEEQPAVTHGARPRKELALPPEVTAGRTEYYFARVSDLTLYTEGLESEYRLYVLDGRLVILESVLSGRAAYVFRGGIEQVLRVIGRHALRREWRQSSLFIKRVIHSQGWQQEMTATLDELLR